MNAARATACRATLYHSSFTCRRVEESPPKVRTLLLADALAHSALHRATSHNDPGIMGEDDRPASCPPASKVHRAESGLVYRSGPLRRRAGGFPTQQVQTPQIDQASDRI